MIYTIYELETGRIEKVVNCPEQFVSLQHDPDLQGFLEGHFDDDSNYVIDDEVHPMGERPSIHHTFDFSLKQWIDPRTHDTEWPLVRAERDRRLLACDWTQLPDVPLATKEVWAIYRQALRDVTLQPDPFNIVWPKQP